MAHLQPFELSYEVAEQQLSVKFEFGFHCFTDDKGHGQPLRHRGETRYFSADRHHCSSQIADYLHKRFFKGLAVPFYVENSQRYYCLDLHDYAVFFRSANRRTQRTYSSFESFPPTRSLNGDERSCRKENHITSATYWKCVMRGNPFERKQKSPDARALGLSVNLNIGLSFHGFPLIPLTG